MLTVERVKKLLNDPRISDEQVQEIMDSFRALCELIYEDWQEKQLNKNK